MAANNSLPRAYYTLLNHLVQHNPDADDVFIGDVGFCLKAYQAEDEHARNAELDRLIATRWHSMHVELVPFARDGAGNRFCFFLPHGDHAGQNGQIVYWMYETRRAVPIATDLRAFLGWIGVSVLETAERGTIPWITRQHFDEVVAPILTAFELHDAVTEIARAQRDRRYRHDERVLRLDPGAGGALLAAAARARGVGHNDRARKYAARALSSFPSFAAAHQLLSELDREDVGGALRALASPLCFSGDSSMPHMRAVPATDINLLTGIVRRGESATPSHLRPLSDLVFLDDPETTNGWLRTALDFADADAIDLAVTASANGLYLARTDSERLDSLTILDELFLATRDRVRLAIVEHDIERTSERIKSRSHGEARA